MESLIVFASGTGTNAAAIIAYFEQRGGAEVSLIVSNRSEAGVLDIARSKHIPFLLIDKHTIHEAMLIDQLQSYNPSLIVLAGFMWKIPESILTAFGGKIINIHPSLLPAYGGKGMYGHHVHEAVIAAKEKESGITIHHVNEAYDEGNIILQARCAVTADDTPSSLANRIHKLEHYYYPRVIEFMLRR